MMPADTMHFDKSTGNHAVALDVPRLNDTSVDAMRHKSEEVLRLKADGRSIDDIAGEAGVTRSTVTRILRYVERAAAS
ncbi:helix-turn-helix domain-containing protein [Rhizobium lusitanum]|uniref:helix-turn-helix domain-containing protein n=1 Tax=Rhizobium TaxID=379 RepID=UPI00161CE87B